MHDSITMDSLIKSLSQQKHNKHVGSHDIRRMTNWL